MNKVEGGGGGGGGDRCLKLHENEEGETTTICTSVREETTQPGSRKISSFLSKDDKEFDELNAIMA